MYTRDDLKEDIENAIRKFKIEHEDCELDITCELTINDDVIEIS